MSFRGGEELGTLILMGAVIACIGTGICLGAYGALVAAFYWGWV